MSKKRRNEAKSILWSAISDIELLRTEYADLVTLKEELKKAVEKITDAMLSRYEEWDADIKYSELEKKIQRKHAYIAQKCSSSPKIIASLLEFANSFWYFHTEQERSLVNRMETARDSISSLE